MRDALRNIKESIKNHKFKTTLQFDIRRVQKVEKLVYEKKTSVALTIKDTQLKINTQNIK